jgi:hypothetical protein
MPYDNISFLFIMLQIYGWALANDIGWESVALVGIHWPILPISASLLGNTFEAISPPPVF